MKNAQTPQINLIPKELVQRRQQSQWISKWIMVVVITTIMIGIPGLYIGGSAALTDSGMTRQIEEANIEYARHQQAIPLLRERLRLLGVEHEVLDLVKNRIEWRDVFSVLVNVADNDVRFSRISATGGGIEGNIPIQINIEGLAPTQTLARAYVVDLENSKMFDSIELMETTREIINELELIRFRITITVFGEMINGGEGSDAG